MKVKKDGYIMLEAILGIITYSLLAVGLFTIFSSSFASMNASNTAIQAQQYAELDANLLKLIDYDDLDFESALADVNLHTARGEIKTVEAKGWEDEVIIGPEQEVNDENESKYRIAKINIYKEGDTLARYSLEVPLSSQASGIGLPIGSIIAWPVDTLPSKPGIWLECNGQSCTAYPKLVAVLGSNNVPNYAGVFLRGYGGQATYHWGVVWHNSANIGELQGDAIRNIIGSFGSEAGVAGDTGNHPATGPFYYRNGYGDHIASNIHSGNNETVFDASRAVPTSNENRPINIAVKWIIKAK